MAPLLALLFFVALLVAGALARRLRDARHEARAAVQSANEIEARWRHTVDIASGVLIGVRPDGTIFEWNPQAERLFGLRREQVMGEDYLRAAVPFEGRDEAADHLARTFAGDVVEAQERFVTDRRGRPRLLRWHVRRVCDAAGSPVAAMLHGIDVTEVHAASRRFALLFEHSSDGHILFDASGVLDCNQAALHMLGLSERLSLAGVHPLELAPPMQPNGLRSRDAAFMAEAMARRQGSHRFEWTLSGARGETIPVEMTLTPIPMEGTEVMLAVWHDQSRRKAAEEAERTTRLQLLQAIDAVDTGFAMYDADERLVLCNAPYRVMLDLALPLVAVGTPLEAILRAALQPRNADEVADEGEVAQLLRHHRNPGPTFDFAFGETTQRITVQRTHDGGRVVTHTDITSAARARDELERTHRAAELARRVADDANRAKSAFLAAMSHELRTPLHSIIGFSRQLQRSAGGALSSTDQMQLQRIEWNGRHLLALIDNLLDLGKIESGEVQAACAPVDLEPFVRAIVSQSPGGRSLRVSVPEPLVTFESDAAKVEQLLQHVVAYVGAQAHRSGTPAILELASVAPGEPPTLVARLEARESGEHEALAASDEAAFDLVMIRALARLLGVALDDARTADATSGELTLLSLDFRGRPARSTDGRAHAA